MCAWPALATKTLVGDELADNSSIPMRQRLNRGTIQSELALPRSLDVLGTIFAWFAARELNPRHKGNW